VWSAVPLPLILWKVHLLTGKWCSKCKVKVNVLIEVIKWQFEICWKWHVFSRNWTLWEKWTKHPQNSTELHASWAFQIFPRWTHKPANTKGLLHFSFWIYPISILSKFLSPNFLQPLSFPFSLTHILTEIPFHYKIDLQNKLIYGKWLFLKESFPHQSPTPAITSSFFSYTLLILWPPHMHHSG
jgi:hypothetical protein